MAEMLTIGELASRTGVSTSALRYYDELGLIPPARRVSGHRRYGAEAVDAVGVLRFLQEVGFTLAEAKRLLGTRTSASAAWRDLATGKVDELRQRIAKESTALEAIEHALACPHDDVRSCPTFQATIASVLRGHGLADAHPATHTT